MLGRKDRNKSISSYRQDLAWYLEQTEGKTGKEEFERNWHKGELEKLISFREPMKVCENDIGDYYCPECNQYIDLFHYEEDYCSNCGQRLDWSKHEK